MMAAETAGENRGGKKIAGMPRNVVIIGVVALVGGIAWFYYKRKQAGASPASAGGASGGQIIGYDQSGNPIYSGSAQTPADFAGELSTLQSEFGSLASEISQMQGGGGGGQPPPPAQHQCPGGAHWDAAKGKCVFGTGEGPVPKPKPKPKPKKKPPRKPPTGGPPGPPPHPGMIWSGAEHKWLTRAQWHEAHVAHQKKVKAKK